MFGKTNIRIKTSPSYVKDGLILHLDGIDYGGDPTKWIDLVNNEEFIVRGNVVRGENCFVFSQQSNKDGIFSAKSFLPTTIEVVFNPKVSTLVYLFGSSSYHKNVTTTINSLQFGGGAGNTTRCDCSINQIHSASSDYANSIWLDGSLITNYLSAYAAYASLSGDYKTGIGASSYTNRLFVGDIYAVRIYDRRLTAEEIAQNFAVDKKRFGI